MVRHGESEANRNWAVNVSMPNHLVPLTETGHKQAQHCGQSIRKWLRPDDNIVLYQSPYTRARQTAEGIIGELTDPETKKRCYKTLDCREDPRLREQDFGNFQEHNAMQAILRERDNYGMFFYRIPNGESPADVFDRCSLFCETLHREFDRHSPSVVILVSHGIWGRVFLMRYFHWTYERFESLENLPNADPVVLQLQNNGKYEFTMPLKTWC